MERTKIYLIWLALFAMGGCTRENLRVTSPSGENTLTLRLSASGGLRYSVRSQGAEVILPSAMGFALAGDSLGFHRGLKLVRVTTKQIDESYRLPTGKRRQYRNRCIEKTFLFRNEAGEDLGIVARAYDDGVAFRYVLKRPGKITVTAEYTQFHLPDSTLSWMMDFVPSYENFYPERALDTISARFLSYPALMRTPQAWVLLTEASVYDQPATHLVKAGPGTVLESALPEKAYTVDSLWASPWRVFIMGKGLGTIVESSLVENLNPPSRIQDMSWIRPGVAVFPWWGNYLANSYPDTLKAYIDLAAKMGWKWIEFDVSLVGSPWHTSRKWETTPWLSELTAYAASKGVHVYGWDEMKTLHSPEGRDFVFGRYRQLHIEGIKIDYMNSDRADAVRFRDSALADAAAKHLLVSFHGASAPRGLRRKWPNLMTEEAVRGAEYYTFKGAEPPGPVHNCTLPFTRNVIGPMDYTPVTFTIRPENPRVTSYAHELALPFIFESGWTCMADRPEMYLRSPAIDMLKQIKTAWDDIHFIDGYPGRFVCLARRSGRDWYVAAINAGSPRTLAVPLDFIKKGSYSIRLYEDGAKDPLTRITVEGKTVSAGDTLHVRLARNGGFCTVFHEAY